MLAEISPVKAPSLCQSMSWPEMAMLVCFVAWTAVEMAVKGGAMTMSQCLAWATSGRNEGKNARVSARVLYIFQLPAIRRRRMQTSIEDRDNAEKLRTQRVRREKWESFVGQGFDAGEFASAKKLEGGAAAGGDVRNLVRDAGLMDRGDGVTATDDGSGAAAGGGGDGFGHFERALRESGHFEYAHGTVPDDGLGGSNFLAIGVDGLGTDIEP